MRIISGHVVPQLNLCRFEINHDTKCKLRIFGFRFKILCVDVTNTMGFNDATNWVSNFRWSLLLLFVSMILILFNPECYFPIENPTICGFIDLWVCILSPQKGRFYFCKLIQLFFFCWQRKHTCLETLFPFIFITKHVYFHNNRSTIQKWDSHNLHCKWMQDTN